MLRTDTPRLKLNDHGIYELHWREGDTPKRRSLRTRERAEAEAGLASFLLGKVQQSDYTVAQAWALREAETLAQVADAQRIRDCWKALLPLLGEHRVSQLKPADFAAYAAARVQVGRSPATARRELVELRATLRHLVRAKRLAADKLPHIGLPPTSPARPYFLTQAQCTQVLNAVRTKRETNEGYRALETFIWLGLNTGQRKRAIETLKWDQVDFEGGMIHFAKEGEVSTKKRKASMPMREALHCYLKREADNSATEWVLGAPVSVRTSFETLMGELGLANVTPHTLRHTFISHLLINREPVFTVSKIVAVSIGEIERTYGHLTRSHMRAALENSIRY